MRRALGMATGASFWLSAVYAEVYGLAALMAALTMHCFWTGAPAAARRGCCWQWRHSVRAWATT
jgi:hypothetical protein